MSDLDILTIDEAQAAIGAPGDQTYDETLARTIPAITALLEARVGPVVIRTITGEVHPGGTWSIAPYQRPVVAITSVQEAWGSTTQTLTAETFGTAVSLGYYFDPILQRIERRESGYDYRFWRQVKITYTAGRYATTADVDPRFKEAAAVALHHNWGLEHGSGNQTFGGFDGVDGQFGRGFALPNRALEILASDVLVPGIA